jgi:biofilm protein TabA
MILDHLDQAQTYRELHPGLAQAFEFLRSADVKTLSVGKHPVDGDRLLAIVGQETGRGRNGAKLEAHRRYIDIQLCLSGDEVIGWRRLADCHDITQSHDAERDIAFFGDASEAWIALPPGHFMVFYPQDAHAPLAGSGPVHKVVMKVAVDW